MLNLCIFFGFVKLKFQLISIKCSYHQNGICNSQIQPNLHSLDSMAKFLMIFTLWIAHTFLFMDNM